MRNPRSISGRTEVTEIGARVDFLQHIFCIELIQPEKDAPIVVCEIVEAVIMITAFLLFKMDHAIDVGGHIWKVQLISFKFTEIVFDESTNLEVVHVHTGICVGRGMIEVGSPLWMYEINPVKIINNAAKFVHDDCTLRHRSVVHIPREVALHWGDFQ
jgi:hypothetical protein